MLLSMTGFGEAHQTQSGLSVAVEIRTINNRYLKISLRASEPYGALEPEIETLVRQQIRRGTVQVNLRITRAHSEADYALNAEVLSGYVRQLRQFREAHHLGGETALESLLPLPGVIVEREDAGERRTADWPLISQTISQALDRLAQMRAREGQAMAIDLRANREQIAAELKLIEQRAPQITEGYRARLVERLGGLLAEHGVTVGTDDLLREVSIFAERTDISEEIVRLRSHLEQFEQLLGTAEGAGRKLDFLTQELFREANTIGSKANDVTVARHVIEIKAAIERIREMVQNVE